MPVISPIQLLVDAAAARWISIPSLFRNADLDSSGDVSKDELKHLLIDLNLHVDFDILWAALDKNHSGSIDEEEWMQAFNGVKPSHTASGNHVPQWQIKPTYNSDTDDGLVALVAHNKMKAQMAAFVEKHIEFFKLARIITTGSTGMTLEQKLGLTVYHKVASGPLGGDQEIGALVTQGKVCGIFFFKDPLSAHQHAADIEALTRVCDVHNVPYATNASAGNALVVAMCILGLKFGVGSMESDTVKSYKSEQAAVIQQIGGKD